MIHFSTISIASKWKLRVISIGLLVISFVETLLANSARYWHLKLFPQLRGFQRNRSDWIYRIGSIHTFFSDRNHSLELFFSACPFPQPILQANTRNPAGFDSFLSFVQLVPSRIREASSLSRCAFSLPNHSDSLCGWLPFYHVRQIRDHAAWELCVDLKCWFSRVAEEKQVQSIQHSSRES